MQNGLLQLTEGKRVIVSPSDFRDYYDLADLDSWPKDRLLGVFEYHRARLGISYHAFCQTWQLGEGRFSAFRRVPGARSPASETVVRAFLRKIVGEKEQPIIIVEKKTFPIEETFEPRPSEEEVLTWTKVQLLNAYEKRREEEGFSHRTFCLGMKLKESDFCSYRNRPNNESTTFKRALREYLVSGFPRTPSPVQPENDLEPLRIPPVKKYVNDCNLQVDLWICSTSDRRVIVLVNGDQDEGNMSLLKTSLMPPSELVFFMIFVRAARFIAVATSWRGFPNVIVRSALSDEKNAADSAITIEATRLALIHPIFQEKGNMIFLATNYKFGKTVTTNLRLMQTHVQVINIQYNHMGIFLARHLHINQGEIHYDPFMKLARQLSSALDLVRKPALNPDDLQSRIASAGITIKTNFRLLLGELKRMRLIVSLGNPDEEESSDE
jgi:hypothetical protein